MKKTNFTKSLKFGFTLVEILITISIIGILSASAVLMQLRLIPLLWGSAVSITSWYAALVLGVFARGDVNSSYVTIFSIYALAVVTMYYILQLIHKKFVPHKEH